jgi:hypothetical protein
LRYYHAAVSSGRLTQVLGIAFMNRVNWSVWLTRFAFILGAPLLGVFQVNRFCAALLAALASFVFALWRFPFVYPSGVLALLVGVLFLFAHLVFGSLGLLFGGAPSLTDWTSYAGAGLGFVAYGCIALVVGKRPPDSGKQIAAESRGNA